MMVSHETRQATAVVAPPDRGAGGAVDAARRMQRRRVLRGTVGVFILAVVIEIISRSGLVDEQFLPPFSVVVVQSVLLLGDGVFLVALGATIASFLLGLLIAAVLGIVLGILFGLSQPLYFAMRGPVELLRPVPPVALIPLIILVLGNGLSMKLVIVVFAAIWPILFNTMYGVHSVDPAQREMAKSFGKSKGSIVAKVVIPGAAPLIATGIRIASSIALIIVITVELITGGSEGLGAFIASSRASGTAVVYVYSGILIAGVLGLVVNLMMAALERRWFGWNSQTGGA